MIKASDKKTDEEKKTEKEESFYKELTTLPFWLNGLGYINKEEEYFYLYDAKKDTLEEILKSDKDNDLNGMDINKDLDKIVKYISMMS